MMKIPSLILVSLALAALLLSCPVLAWSDSMQNGAISYSIASSTSATFQSMYSYMTSTPKDMFGYSLINSGSPIYKGVLISPYISSSTSYYACSAYGASDGQSISYSEYASDRSVIDAFSVGGSYSIPHRVEVVHSGIQTLAYVDGVLWGSRTVGTSSFYYFAFGPGQTSSTITNYVYDYSSSNAYADTAIVAVMPHTWGIQKSILSPTNVVMKDASGNTVYSDHLTVRWSLGPQVDGWNITAPPNTRYSISIFTPSGYQAYTGYINITVAGSATGTVNIPFNATYIGNMPIEYGIYNVYLYDGGGTKSSDYFSVTSSGASIYWGSTLYATGSTATVTWNVDAGYWDTANYNYAIKVVDIYGNTKATYTVTTQTGSTTFSLSGYDAGVYYAELTATPTAGGTAAILYYAATEVTNYATFSPGFVNDETGAGISNATVLITQSSTNATYATAPNGSWVDTASWLAGTPVTIITTKTGYTSETRTFTPLVGGAIGINITLITSPPVYSGVAIPGIVNSSQYGNPISGATVHIKVNGTSTVLATNTSNNAGYYIFNSLVNGTVYDIWSSKTGFFNSTMRQITAVGS